MAIITLLGGVLIVKNAGEINKVRLILAIRIVLESYYRGEYTWVVLVGVNWF
ncbi:MAG: hypothetical protein ACYTE5_01325 [Planctomycetota bacterium]|jgi:hypothetical protein